MIKTMKKLLPCILLAAILCSCATKTVTRRELLTPTLYTAINSDEYLDMKYYGSDAEYDYFTRSYTRYRVLRTENAVPESARFPFNNWMGGKLYRECLTQSATSKLQTLRNLFQSGTTMQQ